MLIKSPGGTLTRNVYQAAKIIISSGRGLTRAEIAEIMGITEMTIGKIAKYLLCSPYFSERKRTAQVGRCSGEIFLVEKYCFSVLNLENMKFSFTVFGSNMELCHRHNTIYNGSLSYTDNLRILSNHIKNFLKDNTAAKILGAGVIYNRNCEVKIENIISPDASKIQISKSRKEIIESLLLKKNTEGFSVYFYLSDKLYACVADGHRIVNCRLNQGIKINNSIKNEKDLIGYLTNIVSNMFNLIIPESIIFESDRYIINEKVLSALRESIKAQTEISEEALPAFCTYKAPSFAESSMLDLLIDEFSQKAANEIFTE